MIKIKLAGPKDFKTVRTTYKESFKEYADSEQFHYFFNFINKDRIKNKEVLLAYDGKKPVGICTFELKSMIFSRAAYLDNIAVIRDYRKKGVGRLLFDKFLRLARAKGVRRVFSNTWPSNEASINFHKKLGFKYCGKIEKASDEKEAYIFFSKKL